MTTAGINDPGVSRAYRDLATETTPPALDDKVLAAAAANTKTRFGLARAWLRPAAWAATVGLSLAFVLDMTRLPETPVAPLELPAGGHPEGRATGGAAQPEEALRRLQADTPPPAATTGGTHPASAAAFTGTQEPARGCDDAQRATPKTWYDCTQSLRESGHVETAELELEALRRAFPDFAVPE